MRRFAALAALLVGVATLEAQVDWRPELDETRDRQLRFEGLAATPATPVRISRCDDVDCAAAEPLAIVTAGSHVVPMPTDSPRLFFRVERGGDRRVIGARRLLLEGAVNFRDLGGLKAADGRTVRWGRLFRSDVLTRLTDADYARLNGLGITLVCDLRGRDERRDAPTVWANGSPTFILAPLTEDAQGRSTTSVVGALASGSMTLAQGQQAFEDFYARIAIDSAAKIGVVMRTIAAAETPALFHCTGGRDRTGLIAALTLEMLGVPREAILADYVASNRYLAERGPLAPMAGLPPERAKLLADVLELQPRYLNAVFARIEATHGNVATYRRQALGLDDDDVAALRARLLH